MEQTNVSSKPIEWPKLSKIIKPVRGQHIAVVREPMADIMQLIDLDLLFVIMADSKPEKLLSEKFVYAARGDVLILGFGLGMIVIPIMNKPEVTSVTIIEIQPEVIELVASQLPLNKKVRIIMGNALLYKPDRLYDRIFWDIDPSAEQINELELKGLHTEPESHYNSFLKPGGRVILWNGERSLYG